MLFSVPLSLGPACTSTDLRRDFLSPLVPAREHRVRWPASCPAVDAQVFLTVISMEHPFFVPIEVLLLYLLIFQTPLWPFIC